MFKKIYRTLANLKEIVQTTNTVSMKKIKPLWLKVGKTKPSLHNERLERPQKSNLLAGAFTKPEKTQMNKKSVDTRSSFFITSNLPNKVFLD